MKKFPVLLSLSALAAIILSGCGQPQPTNFTVSFKNYDGTLLSESKVEVGQTAIYNGPTPTRGDTAEYTYTFTDWDQPLTNITSDCVRVAQYTETLKPLPVHYTVTFKNYDGTVLTETIVEPGATAVYPLDNPTRPEDSEYTYTFKGWDLPLTDINSDSIRIAQYDKEAKPVTPYYTVTFKNYDDAILHEAIVIEGGDAIYEGTSPTRPDTPEFSYSFTGWDKPLTNITSNCIRVAQYEETYIEYTVKFYNYDDTLLYTDTVHYKQTASYYGLTPTKPSTATHNYTFIGWDKDLSSITKSISVNAQFEETGVSKIITVNPNNGDEPTELSVTYGDSYNLGTPSFPGYSFGGWYINGETLIPNSGTWEYVNVDSVEARWESGYFNFAINSSETYTVSLTALGKNAKEIVIPSSYQGVAVTELDTDFSRANTNIEKVTIPGSIRNIPGYAFYNCTKLKEVVLNEGLKSIGEFAFEYCALTKLIIPSGCETISSRAFDHNTSLYHIYIPISVTTIESYAFDVINSNAYIAIERVAIPSGWDSTWTKSYYYKNTTKLVEGEDYNYVIQDFYGDICATIIRLSEDTKKLTSFTFPTEIEGVTDIRVGRYLFNGNLYIRNVDLSSVTQINTYAFASCSNLQSITLSDSLVKIEQAAFRFCTSLTRVEIPTSVTDIQAYAFDECSNITYIYIPKSVAKIGIYAFDACPKSTIYTNAHSNNTNWENNWKGSQPIFYDFVSIEETTDFNYVVQSYLDEPYITISSMKDSAKLKKNIVIPDEIDGISDIRLQERLFNSFTELVSIDLGTGVSNIPDYCFNFCTKLETVVLHEGIKSIRYRAFYNCNKLTSINMPTTLKSIGISAFDYCSSLREVLIPIGVTTIDDYAFDDTGRLVFMIEASVSQSGWSSRWYGTSTNKKSFIYDYVSSGNISDFKYVRASNGVTDTIYITGLKDNSTNVNLIVPDIIDGITNIKISSYAFDGNQIIKSIDLGNSVTAVNGYAFRDCISLISVIIPASCLEVKTYAFKGCNSNCEIHCEAQSQPAGWASDWNPSNLSVDWGYVR